MQEYIDNNRKLWDGMVPVHVASAFYDVPSFRAGRNTLLPVELAEVGPVAGRSLLHLQCHFGMDTLSWARLGADATGVDFSGPAISKARELATELGIPARFIKSDVYQLPDALDERFDIVFASYGIVCWLPDFPRWARIAAGFVKPGGVFYLIDDHPAAILLEDPAESPPYFSDGTPYVYDGALSYADTGAALPHQRSIEFNPTLGEIVTAIVDAGLRIEFLHEFPFSAWRRRPELTKRADGYYHPPEPGRCPLMFSVRATRPLE